MASHSASRWRQRSASYLRTLPLGITLAKVTDQAVNITERSTNS